MRIKIKFFAVLKEIAGKETAIDVPQEISCSDVLLHLQKEIPKISSILDSCLVAVNGKYTDKNISVCEKDEIAILPPVSGG